MQVQFNYDKFLKLSDLGKKKMSLELLMTGVRQVAADQNWDMEPFESTYRKIIEAGYVNEWTWKNSAKSPDKKAVASIFLQHEVLKIDISIVVNDKIGNEIHKEKVISELPDEWAYARHLGEIRWESNDRVALINRNKDKKWIVNLSELPKSEDYIEKD